MPIIDGVKFACEPCMRGHRSSKCNHHDRILIKVRKPGRPLSSCPHEAGNCNCEVASVAIPRVAANCPCGTGPPGATNGAQGHTHAHIIAQQNFNPPQYAPLSNGVYTGDANGFMNGAPAWPPAGGAPQLQPMNVAASQPPYYPPDLDQSFAAASAIVPQSQPQPQPSDGQQQPQEDQNGRRNKRKRATAADGALRQRTQSSDSHTPSAPEPNSATTGGEINLTEASQTQGFTIYSVPRYTPGQLNYLQRIRDAHARQKQEDAETARRASQANEHIQHINGGGYGLSDAGCCGPANGLDNGSCCGPANGVDNGSCCGPANGINGGSCCGPSNGVNEFFSNYPAPDLPFVQPHGAQCGCGDGCGCLMCVTHPYNQASVEYVRSIQQFQSQVHQSPGEDPSSNVDLAPVMANFGFPTAGNMSLYNPGSDLADLAASDNNAASTQPTNLSPSAYIQIDYPLGACTGDANGCLCGDNCTCPGCMLHGQTNGISYQLLTDPSLNAPQTVPADDIVRFDDMLAATDQSDENPTGNDSTADDDLKAEDSSSFDSFVNVEIPEI
ncbi:hypothetical protein TWF696_009367 [Orbilia brochopaga]|uniref:Copper-fist domain-containing protein n=1 Tax=Orbilia brochopaga TaxID=3140254 RepID=A0AAV9UKF1_9PEZI